MNTNGKPDACMGSSSFNLQYQVEQYQQDSIQFLQNEELDRAKKHADKFNNLRKDSDKVYKRSVYDSQSEQQVMPKEKKGRDNERCQNYKIRRKKQAELLACSPLPKQMQQIPPRITAKHQLQDYLFNKDQSHNLIKYSQILRIVRKRTYSKTKLQPLPKQNSPTKETNPQLHQMEGKQSKDAVDRVWIIKNMNDFIKNLTFSDDDDESNDEQLSSLSDFSDHSF